MLEEKVKTYPTIKPSVVVIGICADNREYSNGFHYREFCDRLVERCDKHPILGEAGITFDEGWGGSTELEDSLEELYLYGPFKLGSLLFMKWKDGKTPRDYFDKVYGHLISKEQRKAIKNLARDM